MRGLPTYLAGAALLLQLATGVALAEWRDEPSRILLLYPDTLQYPAIADADHAVRSALLAALPQPLEIYSEGLGSLRGGVQQGHDEALIKLLQKRYEGHPPHLIIAYSGAAVLVAEHRDELWPQTPLMLANIGEERVREGQLPSGIPAATVKIDFKNTFELAMRLQPQARRALVIFGTSQYDSYWGPRALRALDPYRDRIAIEKVEGRTEQELLATVRNLHPDTIVFYVVVTSDRTGRSYIFAELGRRLAAASNAPVYSAYNVQVGNGIAGGFISPLEAEARAIVDIARRLLAGDNPAGIPRSPPPRTVCVVDWRRLVHWQLEASRIPGNCRILFREPPFFETYRGEALAFAVGLAALLALMVGYLKQQRRNRSAKAEASRRSEELAHASRLLSAGQLTAGVTHELNQPLTAIMSNAEVGALLLSRADPPLDELRHIFDDIRDADIRAAEFLAQLRSLLTKRPIALQPLLVNEVVSGTLRLLEHVAKSNEICLSTELRDTLPVVAGDRVHLQQVLLNLVMNAMEAVSDLPPERKRIVVRTDLEAQGQVLVSVCDDGPGIAPDGLARLFEPFYTTKPKGMGLGLSLVREIIQAHGGRIWAESAARGATFRFTLPVRKVSSLAVST